MDSIRVGLVADPAAPTEIARRMTALSPPEDSDRWDIAVVSEPFTTGSEDVGSAMDRLQDHAQRRNWDLVVGLTELPLHDQHGPALVAALATGAVATINSTAWLIATSLPLWRLV